MAADWTALTAFLRGKPDSVALTWRELEDLVGGMPASAMDHTAWWGGDRPHTRAWKAAGYEVAQKRPGTSVTFRRVRLTPPRPSVLPPASGQTPPPQESPVPDPTVTDVRVLLIACAKSKARDPMEAKDIYVSARFRKARRFAEYAGCPWFILSAEHGLVAPDEWIAPYERYLPNTPRPYRIAWGEWVVARLELLLGGSLSGRLIEIHAGQSYVSPLLPPLERRGAEVTRPLEGLTGARWQSWYDAHVGKESGAPNRDATFHGDLTPTIMRLADSANAHTAAELAVLEKLHLDGPGLYSLVRGRSRTPTICHAGWGPACAQPGLDLRRADRREQVGHPAS